MKYKIKHLDEPMIVGVKKLGLQVISDEELMRIVKEVIEKNKGQRRRSCPQPHASQSVRSRSDSQLAG